MQQRCLLIPIADTMADPLPDEKGEGPILGHEHDAHFIVTQ
jgi:hypothetical protein